MDSTKLNDRLQLIASITVIAGLFLVYQELRQNNQIARAERISDVLTDWTQISQVKIENDILALRSKATEQPKEMSDAEVGRLDAFYELIWNNNLHFSVISRLGFGEFDTQAQAIDIAWYLDNAFGRAWMEYNGDWIAAGDPALHDAVMTILQESPVLTEFEYIDYLRQAE